MSADRERLATAVKACSQHATRLHEAIRDLTQYMPTKAAAIGSANAIEVRTIDQFVYRFGKLQDTTGNQLFPALLATLQEPIRDWSVRDRLNRLEQLRILPDVTAWDRIRSIRNRLAHEYPDAPERQAAILNLAWQTVPELLVIVEQVVSRARQSLG